MSSVSKQKLEEAKELDILHSKEIAEKVRKVHAAVIGCSKNNAQVSALLEKSAELCPNAVCKWVEVDKMDIDLVSTTVQECDVAIVMLSADFVVAPMSFQTLIFVLRSIRKPSRYFNLMSTYMALVGNEDYSNSSISLLVGNSMIYNSWAGLLTDWVDKFKNVASNQQSDQGPLPPTPTLRYLSHFVEADAAAAAEITTAMPDYHFHNIVTAADVPTESDSSQCCVLVFVSSRFAADKTARSILDNIIAHKVPMVVVVVTDRSSKSWMQTGLGIILSNELWVDFSVAPFYKPGEIVPSFQKRIRELSIRLRNACIVPTAGTTQSTADAAGGVTAPVDAIDRDTATAQEAKTITTDSVADQLSPSEHTTATAVAAASITTTSPDPDPVRVFISSCGVDSAVNEHDFGPGGFANFLTRAWDKEHAPLRYATMMFHQPSKFRVDADVNISLDTRDFFQVTTECLFLADTSVLFWSPQYVKSFFCYNETFQSLVWQHKRVVIVFLEDFDLTLAALRTMPQHSLIEDRVLAVRGCADNGAPVTVGRLTGVSVVGKSYEQVCGELCDVLLRRPEVSLPVVPTALALNHPHSTSEKQLGFEVLISYCWVNSASAYHAGHVGSVEGRTDPRALRGHLEKATGLRCWLDVEQLGSAGLFQGIHAALSSKHLKCVVLCVSDEYVRSPNCMMELEYAIRRIPCIVVSVGNGYAWRVKLAGYFLAYQETFDFVPGPFPQSEAGTALFAKMAARVSAICTTGAQVTTTALR